MTALLWLLPGLPTCSGGLLLLFVRRCGRSVAITVGALTLVTAVVVALARPVATVRLVLGGGQGLAVDGLSAVMVVVVAVVGLVVLVFAAGEVREARFYGLMLVFVGAMLVTVTAGDLVLLLMGWEVMGAMSYALIGYWWHDGRRVSSGTVAFLTTRAGDLGLYFAAGAAVAGAGAMGLDAAGAAGLGEGGLGGGGLAGLGEPWRDLVAGGIVLAALGKSAQLPFSFWLSRAMDGPSPVSALLHSATMVAAGAYLLLRVQPLLAAVGWAAGVVAWAGAVTALLLGAVAVGQRELKQLLAASTCAQVGFMVCAAGVGAVAGGAAQLVAHAAVKSLLFLAAGVWLSALGTQELRRLGGAGRRWPVVGVSFWVGAVALAGVPPWSLWVTKDVILGAVRSPGLYVVLLGAAVLAAAYSAKALASVWRAGEKPSGAGRDEAGKAREVRAGARRDEAGRAGAGRAGVREVTAWEQAPLPVLALAAAGLGAVGLPGVFEAWGRLVGDPHAAAPSASGLAWSGGLAIVVAATVTVALMRRHPGTRLARSHERPTRLGADERPTRLGADGRLARLRAVGHPAQRAVGRLAPLRAVGRPARVGAWVGAWVARIGGWGARAGEGFASWLWLERAAVTVIARPVMALARALARFDDRAIDAAVEAVPRAGMSMARLARKPFEARLDDVVQTVAGAAGRLGGLARRPQTGQVHLYFAQAAVALTVLAIVFALLR
ncbi:hypothetical protein GCM10009850_116450 [Nonomuraea monospora]|uniref:NADH:quinone oxidoreductase/Mrp antiporter transmembrane domain-containing protein n=1 Tax=Nonomuraea monospora TaxID=568818 RepID=A0ABN3D307_9ACTN